MSDWLAGWLTAMDRSGWCWFWSQVLLGVCREGAGGRTTGDDLGPWGGVVEHPCIYSRWCSSKKVDHWFMLALRGEQETHQVHTTSTQETLVRIAGSSRRDQDRLGPMDQPGCHRPWWVLACAMPCIHAHTMHIQMCLSFVFRSYKAPGRIRSRDRAARRPRAESIAVSWLAGDVDASVRRGLGADKSVSTGVF